MKRHHKLIQFSFESTTILYEAIIEFIEQLSNRENFDLTNIFSMSYITILQYDSSIFK